MTEINVSKRLAAGIICGRCMRGAPKSNNDQNITLKVGFHVISIVCQRNFINTLKILRRGPASRAEIACRFKVSSTPEENNYKITERNTLNLSSAFWEAAFVQLPHRSGPDVPRTVVHIFRKVYLNEVEGRGRKIFPKRDTIPSLLNRLVERKRVNKAFLLQRFFYPFSRFPHAPSRLSLVPPLDSIRINLTYRTKLFFNFSLRKYFPLTNSNSMRRPCVTWHRVCDSMLLISCLVIYRNFPIESRLRYHLWRWYTTQNDIKRIIQNNRLILPSKLSWNIILV